MRSLGGSKSYVSGAFPMPGVTIITTKYPTRNPANRFSAAVQTKAGKGIGNVRFLRRVSAPDPPQVVVAFSMTSTLGEDYGVGKTLNVCVR